MPEEQRSLAIAAVEAHAHGEVERVKALTDTILESVHDDDAMMNLIQRLRQTHKGESYVLG